MVKEKQIKERVVAFRLPETLAIELDKQAQSSMVVGIRSGNQFARKLVIDFLAGRLHYLSKGDRTHDPVVDVVV